MSTNVPPRLEPLEVHEKLALLQKRGNAGAGLVESFVLDKVISVHGCEKLDFIKFHVHLNDLSIHQVHHFSLGTYIMKTFPKLFESRVCCRVVAAIN